jgi:4-hydroxy-tetrahydrodipicolinate synthase
MKKRKIFEGVATAIVTPFKSGKIDFDALARLIDMQIDGGVAAIVVCGTTGECATLTDSERYSLYEATQDLVGGRARLIFGTGTNDTSVMLRHSREARKYSPDGLLVVSPYYNKGTDLGILEHYKALLNSVDLPIIIYNVPSRTGVNLSLSILNELKNHENLVGIKEAGDSLSRYVSLSSLGDDIPLYAGNDNHIYPALSLGGVGAISVVSNVLPKETVEIYRLASLGKWQQALSAQLKMISLIDALFCETNPAPVKWLMHSLGLISDEIRLPLTMPREESRITISNRYHEYLSLNQ